MELDHGGDAGVPVQKDLVVQFCDTCPKRHSDGPQRPAPGLMSRTGAEAASPVRGPGRLPRTHRPSRGSDEGLDPRPQGPPHSSQSEVDTWRVFGQSLSTRTHEDARAELRAVRRAGAGEESQGPWLLAQPGWQPQACARPSLGAPRPSGGGPRIPTDHRRTEWAPHSRPEERACFRETSRKRLKKLRGQGQLRCGSGGGRTRG